MRPRRGRVGLAPVRFVGLAIVTAGLIAGPAARAEPARFARADWALGGSFPAEPRRDDFRAMSPYGKIVSERFFVEADGEAFMLVRSVHPVVADRAGRPALLEQIKRDALAARPGDIVAEEELQMDGFAGRRWLIEHRRAKRTKELRVVVVGGEVYAVSYERPAGRPASPRGAAFLAAVVVQPAYADYRAVEERGRWREVREGRFVVRYDATRWYRDPSDREAGIVNLLRLDERAEAQLIAEPPAPGAGDVAELALAAARDSAESVTVRRRGTKLRAGTSFAEVEYVVRFQGDSFVNRGYFYRGPEGMAQFRTWASEREFDAVAGDLAELLDGLSVVR